MSISAVVLVSIEDEIGHHARLATIEICHSFSRADFTESTHSLRVVDTNRCQKEFELETEFTLLEYVWSLCSWVIYKHIDAMTIEFSMFSVIS